MGGLAAGIVFFLLVQYTVLGPLGTGQTMGWLERLGYWGLVGGLQFPIVYSSGVLALYLVRYRRPIEIILVLAAMVLILAASCTAIAFAIYGLFQGGRFPEVPVAMMYGVCALNLGCSVALMYHVAWLRLSLKRQAGGESGLAPIEPALETDDADTGGVADKAVVSGTDAAEDHADSARHQDEPVAGISLLDRLPEELGRDVIYLKASAHNVEVITTTGSAAILMRISDAAAEFRNLGMLVHRSYWVAYRHVKHAVRRDGRTLLVLTSDHEVPISRGCMPEVRAAVPQAWIRGRRRNLNDTSPAPIDSS